MDKTFMRFDVSTQESDDCKREKKDSAREREREKKRKDEFSALFR